MTSVLKNSTRWIFPCHRIIKGRTWSEELYHSLTCPMRVPLPMSLLTERERLERRNKVKNNRHDRMSSANACRKGVSRTRRLIEQRERRKREREENASTTWGHNSSYVQSCELGLRGQIKENWRQEWLLCSPCERKWARSQGGGGGEENANESGAGQRRAERRKKREKEQRAHTWLTSHGKEEEEKRKKDCRSPVEEGEWKRNHGEIIRPLVQLKTWCVTVNHLLKLGEANAPHLVTCVCVCVAVVFFNCPPRSSLYNNNNNSNSNTGVPVHNNSQCEDGRGKFRDASYQL